MEDCIEKAINLLGVDERQLKHKKPQHKILTARYMLWLFLHQERGVPYSRIARRFGFTQRNVIWACGIYSGNLKYHRGMREEYDYFVEKMRASL